MPDKNIQVQPICHCWRCFFQNNFTAVSLFIFLIICLALTILLIHEKSVDDKFATWMEGFTGGVFSAWTLALKAWTPDTGSHIGPTTNIALPPDKPEEKKQDTGSV